MTETTGQARTLREQIARRLYDAGCAAGGPSPSPRKRAKFWLAQADEVIRLMEWARQRCACDRNDYVGSPDMPLTLPPEDWKP